MKIAYYLLSMSFTVVGCETKKHAEMFAYKPPPWSMDFRESLTNVSLPNAQSLLKKKCC